MVLKGRHSVTSLPDLDGHGRGRNWKVMILKTKIITS